MLVRICAVRTQTFKFALTLSVSCFNSSRLAPEVIKHSRSSQFSDVYGYGIVLWELATREEVYQGLETYQIISKVANENLRPPVPEDCPWKDIMVTCWAENPLDRLEFREIVEAFTELKRKLCDEVGVASEVDGHQREIAGKDSKGVIVELPAS
jgi:hypothetical protein